MTNSKWYLTALSLTVLRAQEPISPNRKQHCKPREETLEKTSNTGGCPTRMRAQGQKLDGGPPLGDEEAGGPHRASAGSGDRDTLVPWPLHLLRQHLQRGPVREGQWLHVVTGISTASPAGPSSRVCSLALEMQISKRLSAPSCL